MSNRKFLFGFYLFIILVVLFFVSIKSGEVTFSFFKILKGNLSPQEKIILFNLRLPRTLGSILTGAILGVTGAVLQNILRNPLASPFTIGVSQGAGFGAAFSIIILNGKITVFCAFIGGIITSFILFLISLVPMISSNSLILAGVAISSFFSASTMFLKYFATDIQVASAVFWTFGDLSKATWDNLSIMTIFFIPIFLFFMKNSWNYNAFIWGDETAKSLGVNVKFLIIITLILSSLLCAVNISYLGIIGFVGLIAPHIVRIIIGEDYRYLIPYSMINGANIMLLSDILSRLVLKPIEIPVGIITSFLGVPVFLYILLKKRNA